MTPIDRQAFLRQTISDANEELRKLNDAAEIERRARAHAAQLAGLESAVKDAERRLAEFDTKHIPNGILYLEQSVIERFTTNRHRYHVVGVSTKVDNAALALVQLMMAPTPIQHTRVMRIASTYLSAPQASVECIHARGPQAVST